MASYILIAVLLLATVFGDTTKLHSVFSLIKSGSVTPSLPIPFESWEKWDEKAAAELTGMGMREQYLLGREIRRQYNEHNLINSSYIIDQLDVRSILNSSSILSAQSFLRGFLGETQERLSTEELTKALPPIPVNEYFIKTIGNHTLPMSISILPYHNWYPNEEDIFNPLSCPKAINLTHAEYTKSLEMNLIVAKYNTSLTEIAKKYYPWINEKYLSYPLNLIILDSIYNAAHLRKPLSLSNLDMEIINKYENEIYYYTKCVNPIAVSYWASQPLSFIQKFFETSLKSAINSPSRLQNLKSSIVFGEDKIFMSILSVFGNNVTEVLKPSSMLTFEAWGPEKPTQINEMTIKMLFNAVPTPIGKCPATGCKFEEFIAEIKKHLVTDIKKLCNPNQH